MVELKKDRIRKSICYFLLLLSVNQEEARAVNIALRACQVSVNADFMKRLVTRTKSTSNSIACLEVFRKSLNCYDMETLRDFGK